MSDLCDGLHCVLAEAKEASSSSSTTLLQRSPSYGRDYLSPYGNPPAASTDPNHQQQHRLSPYGNPPGTSTDLSQQQQPQQTITMAPMVTMHDGDRVQQLGQREESNGRDFKSPYLQSNGAGTGGGSAGGRRQRL
jgi:hypothetical protein